MALRVLDPGAAERLSAMRRLAPQVSGKLSKQDLNSISFRAQDVGQVLDPLETFFVNVFFLPSTSGPTDFRFEGAWLTEFSPNPTPLPAALPLFATGLGALGLLGWRRKKKAAAAMAA